MRFTKMHGAGNDYVYVDCTKMSVDNAGAVSRFVSDRHFGIGSDGLILIKSSDKADFFMEMYNADGSQGQMCGNGIRCVAKYVYDYGLTEKKEFDIDTLAGVKHIVLSVDESTGKVSGACVSMGSPILKASDIPVKLAESNANNAAGRVMGSAVVGATLDVLGTEYTVTCVSMGNPHCVVFVDDDFDLDNFKIEQLGPYFENHEMFPERINTEFVKVIDRHNLKMRVWERGAGETLCCGTGSCATLVAAVLNNLADDEAIVHVRGGELKIRWDKASDEVYMEGPAVTVYEGDIDITGIK